MGENMKKCIRCGKIFLYTNEYFNYRNKKENILFNHCKSCQRNSDKKVKENDSNRIEQIAAKVTLKEKEKIELNAKKMGIDLAKYLRYVAIKNEPIIIKNIIELEPIENAFGNIEYQIKKLGTNVNQISKNLNEGGSVSENTILSLVGVLEKLNLRLTEIEKVIAKGYQNLD